MWLVIMDGNASTHKRRKLVFNNCSNFFYLRISNQYALQKYILLYTFDPLFPYFGSYKNKVARFFQNHKEVPEVKGITIQYHKLRANKLYPNNQFTKLIHSSIP